MKFLKILFSKSNQIPRWFIFLFDIGLCGVAYILAVFFRFSLDFNSKFLYESLRVIPIILLVKGISIGYFRLHASIIRHTSVQDGLKIFYTSLIASLILFVIDSFYNYFPSGSSHIFPISIILIDFILCTFFLAAFRFFVKLMYMRINMSNNKKTTLFAIYGAGEAAVITKRKLEQESSQGNKVVVFFDDNPNMVRKSLEGITIFNGGDEFENIVSKFRIENLIIAIPSISKNRKQDIIEKCLGLNINVRTVPPVEKWINGELSFKQIKNVKIEDLIERDVIELDKNAIGEHLDNMTILVTGAGGSIGSEIVRQILRFKPKKLICLDKSEIKLYELDSFLVENHQKEYNTMLSLVLGDITNIARMEYLFKTTKPDFVYHAAAYKHVPLVEDNPGEAVYTNVNGTKILADLSVKYQVKRFVFVSTDKAVNPTNVMGASKRIAEMYVQALNMDETINKGSKTRFITTRFGNVLGSSGSVIPRFRAQIESGGPITVTHPDVTRFFMTIPEACQLVLEAGNMGKGGEIYLFDMGKSVKIIDLAKKMVKLSDLTLGQDIQIVFSGLRPGEKIYEELLNDSENTLPTHHPKIMIGKVRHGNYPEVNRLVVELIRLYDCQNKMELVHKMKDIVPEFLSKNSIFESLDKKAKLPEYKEIKQILQN